MQIFVALQVESRRRGKHRYHWNKFYAYVKNDAGYGILCFFFHLRSICLQICLLVYFRIWVCVRVWLCLKLWIGVSVQSKIIIWFTYKYTVTNSKHTLRTSQKKVGQYRWETKWRCMRSFSIFLHAKNA